MLHQKIGKHSVQAQITRVRHSEPNPETGAVSTESEERCYSFVFEIKDTNECALDPVR